MPSANDFDDGRACAKQLPPPPSSLKVKRFDSPFLRIDTVTFNLYLVLNSDAVFIIFKVNFKSLSSFFAGMPSLCIKRALETQNTLIPSYF